MLRYARALPSEQRVQEMTDGDYLYCLIHEMLDREEALESLCPNCRERAEQLHCTLCGTPLRDTSAGANAGFDMERFMRMKEGGTL
ncbi:MAG: molybdopterin oxidoreductase [Eubacteriales bacterium]|nr:molybdopterin oxidoreductase [Eubacteriales bacterium]